MRQIATEIMLVLAIVGLVISLLFILMLLDQMQCDLETITSLKKIIAVR